MTKALAVLFLPLALVAADVTGLWQFDVQTDAGGGSPTFDLKQAGEKLSGTYQGLFGKAEVRGSVRNDEVIIEFDTDATGEKTTVRYSGKLEGSDKMSGKVTFGSMSGTFTGRKK